MKHLEMKSWKGPHSDRSERHAHNLISGELNLTMSNKSGNNNDSMVDVAKKQHKATLEALLEEKEEKVNGFRQHLKCLDCQRCSFNFSKHARIALFQEQMMRSGTAHSHNQLEKMDAHGALTPGCPHAREALHVDIVACIKDIAKLEEEIKDVLSRLKSHGEKEKKAQCWNAKHDDDNDDDVRHGSNCFSSSILGTWFDGEFCHTQNV